MAWSFYDQNGKVLQGVLAVSIGTTEIADDAVTYAKLQNLATADRVLGSTSTGLIGEVQVVADMIASDAVTTAKIANDQVTGAKLTPALVVGDIIYADGTDTITRLAKGAASTTLKMNSGASAPEWVAVGAGVGLGMVLALGG